ncbi:hypothetical protein AB9F39_37585, partial [Rhizobium leguminosarum]
TVSTNVLAAGKIAFDPPLPDKIEAAAQLPLGLADNLFLRLASREALPADTHMLGSTRRGETATLVGGAGLGIGIGAADMGRC